MTVELFLMFASLVNEETERYGLVDLIARVRTLTLLARRARRPSLLKERLVVRELDRLLREASRRHASGEIVCPCLPRSLAGAALAAVNGVRLELWIGARRADHRLDAHAWLRFDNRVLGDEDREASLYSPVMRVQINSGEPWREESAR